MLFTTTPAMAQISHNQTAPWIKIGEFYDFDQSFDIDHKGAGVLAQVYIDPASIRKHDFFEGHKEEFYEFHYREVYERPKKVGAFQVQSKIHINLIDCAEKKSGTAHVTLYDSNQEILDQTHLMPPTMRKIKNDTISEKTFEYLCKQRY